MVGLESEEVSDGLRPVRNRAADGLRALGDLIAPLVNDVPDARADGRADNDADRATLRNWQQYPWGDHDPELFETVERFYRPAYTASLVPEWIPALDGIEARLRAGAAVVDVGCGHGLSTVLMAKAFPVSRFLGIDDHAASIDRARRLAADEGVGCRIRFEVRPARELDGTFDLITVLDAFHDMGEPEKVAARLRDCLAPAGACMIVEPFAGDRLIDNLTRSVARTTRRPHSRAPPRRSASRTPDPSAPRPGPPG